MGSAGELNEDQHREITIRFPHVDHAGIMFYPRYVELLQANFPDLALFSTPTNFHIEFLLPNRLGDRIDLTVAGDAKSDAWTVTGKIDDQNYFVVKSAKDGQSTFAPDEHRLHERTFVTSNQVVGAWSVGQDSRLFLSRYFELLNIAVEEWFEDTLQLPFYRLHVEHEIGIPTVSFSTRCRALPKLGDSVCLKMLPTRLGGRSMTAKSWLLCNDECLIETEQTIVFVRMLDEGYESVSIPDRIRDAFHSRMET